MPANAAKASAKPKPTDTSAAVDAFMAGLEHPFKAEIELLRKLFLGVGEGIAEGIKWNAPSFRTTEYFATTHLRGKGTIGVILHLGAKVRDLPAGGVVIEDPAGLLKWLAKDRAMIEFSNMSELKANQAALEEIIRQWVRYV